MATMITSDCINCGACEPECPNTAIYQGGVEWELNGVKHPPLSMDVFYIVPEKCTECVGFHDQEACAAVCPVDVCIPNPDIPESEAELLDRARQLHPGVEFGADFPSRFRAEGTKPAAAQPAAEDRVTASDAPPPAAARPPGAPASVSPEPRVDVPEIDDWEIPIECHGCGGAYAVAFRHLRSGIVLRCPYCGGPYVVTTSMHGNVSRALREFSRRWSGEFESFRDRRARELVEFEERQRRELESFEEELKRIAREVRAPGAPRKRAWLFG
jgi:ferredoxin